MKTATIRQELLVRGATPHDIYEMLLDSRKHAAFTDYPARIERKVGGQFEAGGGYITGRNLELHKDRKIIQAWRADEPAWPADHFSRATVSLKKVKGGTRLSFYQSGIPARYAKIMKQGWWEYYWNPLKETFAAKPGPRKR